MYHLVWPPRCLRAHPRNMPRRRRSSDGERDEGTLEPPPKRATIGSAHADASAADSGNVEHAELDPTTLMALQEHTEAFVCGFSPSEDTEDPQLQESQLKQALELARANSSLHTLGVDGTGCALSADTARALGSIPVKALKFVGLSFARNEARVAFAEAAATNDMLATISIFETDADGEWCRFDPSTSKFASDLLRRRKVAAKGRQLPPLSMDQVATAAENGDEAGEDDEGVGDEEEEEDGESEGEDEDDEDDYVECDGRMGSGRKAPACGKRLRGDDMVFHSALGRDYCADCHARLGRGERQTTAAERIQEEMNKKV